MRTTSVFPARYSTDDGGFGESVKTTIVLARRVCFPFVGGVFLIASVYAAIGIYALHNVDSLDFSGYGFGLLITAAAIILAGYAYVGAHLVLGMIRAACQSLQCLDADRATMSGLAFLLTSLLSYLLIFSPVAAAYAAIVVSRLLVPPAYAELLLAINIAAIPTAVLFVALQFVRYAVVPQVVAAEGVSGLAAFKRSAELSVGSFRFLATRLVLLNIAVPVANALVAAAIATAAGTLFDASGFGNLKPDVSFASSIITQLTIAALVVIYNTLVYSQLMIRAARRQTTVAQAEEPTSRGTVP